jgi:hypothetical protein
MEDIRYPKQLPDTDLLGGGGGGGGEEEEEEDLETIKGITR